MSITRRSPWASWAGLLVCPLLAGGLAAAEVPTLNEVQKLLPPEGGELTFGGAISLDGDRAVVGSRGVKYEFTRDSDGIWHATSPVSEGQDCCVPALALDGDTAVFGHWYEESLSGAVYVYVRGHTGVWTEQARLNASDGAPFFGSRVALSGNTLAVAARTHVDDFCFAYSGSVYVFTRDVTGAWHEQAKLRPADAKLDDMFGLMAISLQGDTLAVGAPFDSDSCTTLPGSVYVYEHDASGTWSQQAKLMASDGTNHVFFGSAIALEGDVLVIGAPGDDKSNRYGAIYAFSRSASGNWQEEAKLRPGDVAADDWFGWPIAFDGHTAIAFHCYVSSSGVATQERSGHVFTRDASGIWTERVKLSPSQRPAQNYGCSAAIDDGAAMIGDWWDRLAGGSGAVYVFDMSAFYAAQTIAIDVKPGDNGNAVNPRSMGRLWTAVLSGEDFDALQTDVSTVELGPNGAWSDRLHVRDINRDGQPDLLLRFRTPEIGVACGDEELELTGETYLGQAIVGSDAIRTVGCTGKRRKPR